MACGSCLEDDTGRNGAHRVEDGGADHRPGGRRTSAEVDRLDGLSKIGIDEVSFRRGQRYLTVVVNHETARVVWVEEGRDDATLDRFFDRLGPARLSALRFVTADGALWIKGGLARRCPQATVCMDPFHVVAWANEALDQVRRQVWNEARRAGHTNLASALSGARFALRKNPENLTHSQTAKLADIARINRPLYRAFLLKEQLREVFRLPFRAGVALLEHWIAWASRSRLVPFVRVARRIELTGAPSRPLCNTA